MLGSTQVFAQLNEDIRKKIEKGQPLHEVIQEAEAAAQSIGKGLGAISQEKSKNKVSPEDLNLAFAGITANWSTAGFEAGAADGVLKVSNIEPASAAANAGLMLGDTIKSLDGGAVKGIGDFLLAVGTKFEGKVEMEIERGGKPVKLSLDLGKPATKKGSAEWDFKPTAPDKKADKEPAKPNGKVEKPEKK
jgi:S1-C subfamily serine protease